MSNKEIDLDDDDIFKDMGDDFGDLDLAEPKVPTGREAMLQAPKTAIAGAANALFGEGKRRQILTKMMPNEFSVALDAYDNLASDGTDLYRHAKDELTKSSRQLKSTVRQAMPVISPFLPKSVSDKVKEWSSPEYGIDSHDIDKTEAGVAAGMQGIFEGGADPESYVKDRLEQKVRDIKTDNVHDVIAHIGSNIEEYTVYNRTVGNSWRKKLLEVNLRQYFAIADLAKGTAESNQKIVDSLAAITKNTALPDYAKEEFGEITKAMMKRKIIEKLSPANFARNYFKILGNETRAKISEFFGGARDILSAAGDASEMVSSANGLDEMSDEQRRATMGGGAAKQLGAHLANKYVRPTLDKGLGRARKWAEKNDKVMSPILRAAAIMSSLPDRLNTYGQDPGYDGSEPEWLKKIFRFVGSVGPQGGQESVRMDEYDTSAIDAPAAFTKRSTITLNEIIPGLLARIDRSVRRLQDPSADLEAYDFSTRTFKSMQQTAERINSVFKNKDTKDYQRQTSDELIKYLEKTGGRELSKDARNKLGLLIQDKALKNTAFDVRSLGKNFDAYGQHYSDELMDFFSELSSNSQNADRAELQTRLSLGRIRGLTGQGQRQLDEHLDRYGAEALKRAGVLVDDGGKLVINPNYLPYMSDMTGPEAAPSAPPGVGGANGGGLRGLRARRAGLGPSPIAGTPGIDAAALKPIVDSIQKLESGLPGTIEAAILAANEKAGKSKPQRQTKTNKILEEILEQLKVNNVAPRVDEILEAIQQGGGWGFGRNPFKGAGAWAGKQYDKLSRLSRRTRRKAKVMGRAAWRQASKVANFETFRNAKDTVFGAITNLKDGILGNRNIYDDEGNVILVGRLLAAGAYYTKDGKQITSLKDITGGVYNKDGEPIISEEDMQAKMAKLRYWNGKGWKFLGTDLPGMIGGGIRTALGRATTFRNFVNSKAAQFAKYVYTWAITDEDIYTADNLNTPRLYNSLMMKGWYVSETTGKPIRQVSDIDGPVITKHKEPVITAQELADPNFKLVGKNGKPIQGVAGKMFGGAKLLGGTAMRAGQWMMDKARKAGDAIRGVLGGTFDLPKIFGENGFLARMFGAGTNKVVERLDDIYELLKDRLRGGSGRTGNPSGKAGPDGSDVMGRYHEREKKRKAAAAPAPSEKAKGKPIKDRTLEMLSQIRDNLAAKKEKVKAKFGFGGTASADSDGDGVRDNSFIDIFRKRKAAADKRRADKAAAAGVAEKPQGMFGKLLGMITAAVGAAGTFIGKGFMTIVEKLLGPVIRTAFDKVLGPLGKTIMNSFKWGGELIGTVMSGGWDLLKKGGKGIVDGAVKSATEGGIVAKGLELGKKVLTKPAGWLARGAAAVMPWLGTAGEAIAGVAAAGGEMVLGALTAPVLGTVAAVAAIGYAGYKLATRKVATSLDQFRFAQYGTTDYHREDLDDVAKIRYLEANYIKYVAYDKDGVASIRGVDPKTCDKIAEGFGLDLKDENNLKMWNEWLHGRFIPIFLLWTSRARQFAPAADFTKIGDIKTVNPKDQLKIFDACVLNASHPVFSVVEGPFDDKELISYGDLVDVQKDMRSELEDLLKYTPSVKMAGEQQAVVGNLSAASQLETGEGKVGIIEKVGAVGLLWNRIKSTFGFGGDEPETTPVTAATGVDIIGKATTPAGRVVSGQVDALVAIRMRTYGLYKLRADRIAQLYRLEDYMKPRLMKTKTEVTYRGDLEEDVRVTAGFFGIMETDSDGLRNYAAWFRTRFVPVFLGYVSAVNKFLPNGDPFLLTVNGSTPQLYDIATAIIATRTQLDGKSAPVFQVNFTPWRDDNDMPMEDVNKAIDANLRYLDSLRKAAVIAEQTAKEQEKRQFQAAAANKQQSNAGAGGMSAGPAGNSMIGDIFDSKGNLKAVAVDPVTGQPSTFGGYDTSMGGMTELADRGSGNYAELRKLPADGFDSVGSMLVAAAKLVGIDPGLLLTVGMMESGLDPKAGAKSSSAKGLFQFINGTWKQQLDKYGNTYGIPDSAGPMDPWANAILGAQYLKDGAKAIMGKIGNRPITPTDVYMTHFMGPGGGPAFLKHLADTPDRIAAVDFKSQAAANPGVFGNPGAYMTYAQVYEKLQQRARSNFSHVRKFVSNDPNAKAIDPKKLIEDATKDKGMTTAPDGTAEATKAALDKKAAISANAAANAVATPAGSTSTAAPAAAANAQAKAAAADTASTASASVEARNNVEAARVAATMPDDKAAQAAFSNARAVAKDTGDIGQKQLLVQQQMLEQLKLLVQQTAGSSGPTQTTSAPAPTQGLGSQLMSLQQPRGVISPSN